MRLVGWCVCVPAIAVRPSVPHFAARLACLRLLATAYLLLLLLLLLLLGTPLLPSTLPSYLPPPNPTRLSTRLHQSTSPPSQPAIRYPGLSRRLPASQTIAFDPDSQPATQDPLFLPCFAFPRSPSTRGALPPSLLFLRVAPGGEPLHALLVTTYVRPARPAGPEETARLGRFRPTMRRANRVSVA